jgi:hypothetical protein
MNQPPMMATTPSMSDTKPALTSADVEAVEKALGYGLPAAYRAFVLRHNGGHPEPSWFQVAWEDQPWAEAGGWDVDMVHFFFALKEGDRSPFLEACNGHKGRMPYDFIPFANDPGGNLLAIGTCAPNLGKVYLWLREYETDDGEPDLWNMGLVADSFEDFLASLYDPDESPPA